MFEDYIKCGDSVLIHGAQQRIQNINEELQQEMYRGKIKRILSDSEIEVEMREEESIDLSKNQSYVLSINASSRLYMCNTYFQSMYQEGQTVIILEIVSPLERLQRRMHQRVSCHAMISYRILQDKEIHDMIDREDAVSFPQTGMAADAETESLIDISGGGVRFTSKQKLDIGNILETGFSIQVGEEQAFMRVMGEVVFSDKLRNGQELYDIRMKFIHYTKEQMEQIIRFCFRLERESIMAKWHRGGGFL